ncbi:hypothetical protein DBR40_06110 [Pedobacter sp. KBW01]|nr:hypothetical protein DBR40_06110 [Pedobacter sp. KBW01]
MKTCCSQQQEIKTTLKASYHAQRQIIVTLKASHPQQEAFKIIPLKVVQPQKPLNKKCPDHNRSIGEIIIDKT